MITARAAKGRVRKGARLLDQYKPGWRNLVKSEVLNMSLSYRCVLGQLFGDYSTGERKLFGDNPKFTDSVRHGFMTGLKEGGQSWEVLADAWKDELKAEEKV